jgi:hypothetical protein
MCSGTNAVGPIPLDRSRWARGLKRGTCGRSLAGNADSIPAVGMDVCHL